MGLKSMKHEFLNLKKAHNHKTINDLTYLENLYLLKKNLNSIKLKKLKKLTKKLLNSEGIILFVFSLVF